MGEVGVDVGGYVGRGMVFISLLLLVWFYFKFLKFKREFRGYLV